MKWAMHLLELRKAENRLCFLVGTGEFIYSGVLTGLRNTEIRISAR